jgi:class 3 adenylate cyclase/tetratricopeptide (TPR) repeat protein
MRCARCGNVLEGAFAFCPFCGAPQAEERPAGREERKVVSVLFADLAGFTARAEHLDPEDVRALLAPYHAHLRAELERFGGTVEKFIGDAVMALFGAPVAHEDDPERAVRAALEIRDWAAEQDDLQVRIAVATGEVLVALDARPGEGEAMAAGDVVNTAARLQAAAPLNGVLVGEQTYRATSGAIEYREAAPVAAKGKTDPIPVWEAVRARARFGVDVAVRAAAPLVGRSRELDLLTSTLDRVLAERSPQLVTLVGVPGIGKSRLTHELLRSVEQHPELIRWRQGRSLPYGDGVTFWARAEIVKAQAGILESDTQEQAAEKLHDAVERIATDTPEAHWLERNLRPLAGFAEEGAASTEERFAAWRRFLELLAEQRPCVLVFEDLHWADDALLEFVDGLVDRAGSVPLLVLATARPELLQRRSSWGGGKPNAITVSLSPLTEEETAQLVHALLDQPLLEAEIQEALLARAGGNPLYAEQYARMLRERGTVGELPETVQGIIAARLDALTDEQKQLLQNASVVGKVFWLGSSAAVGDGTRWQAEELLHVLERMEFVQRARSSSVASETEYAFRHVLIRDIAYAQIPRAARARKHQAVAGWIESLGRPEDQAELLAFHYQQALELAEAAGLETEALAASARVALRDAGDRAVALFAFSAAESYYDAALRLWPVDDPERALLLFRRAAPIRDVADWNVELLTEARDALLAAGDRVHAAEAETMIGQAHWLVGQGELAEQRSRSAIELIEGAPPSKSTVWVLTRRASRSSLRGDDAAAIEIGMEALRQAEEIGWVEGMTGALSIVGIARLEVADSAGLDQVRRSVELSREAGELSALPRALNTLGVCQQMLGDLDAGYETRLEGQRVSIQLGSAQWIRWFESVMIDHRYRRGDWDASLREADAFLAAVEGGAAHYNAFQAYAVRAEIRLARGDVVGALRDSERSLEIGRPLTEPQAFYFVLQGSAHVFALGGAVDRALELAREVIDALERGEMFHFAVINLPLFAIAARHLGLTDDLLRALEGRPASRWIDAARAYCRGEFAVAADLLAEAGDRPAEAEARLQAGQLDEALAFYRKVGVPATDELRRATGS